jgi:glycine cleavage system H protein
MSEIPDDLKYTKNHEWVRIEDDGSLTVGITDHAQEALGDLVFVECPEIGRKVEAEEACAVVESVKAASDIYAPLAGEIIEINDALSESPEIINQDTYGGGWIFRLQPEEEPNWSSLLEADAYAYLLENEE